jgi:5-formyltetrahydrofolate cyclo-ligase
MRDKKQTLRARVSLQRESFSPSEIGVWNRLIQEKALNFSLYLRAENVALYSAIGNEVSTTPIMEHALKTGKSLFYPRMEYDGQLTLVKVPSSASLRPGPYGVLEPLGGLEITLNDLATAIVFVPGIAFDAAGNRLGRGKGAYDRLLEKLGERPGLVALAYEFQIVNEIPTDEQDRKVHYIITERRTINCIDKADPAIESVS